MGSRNHFCTSSDQRIQRPGCSPGGKEGRPSLLKSTCAKYNTWVPPASCSPYTWSSKYLPGLLATRLRASFNSTSRRPKITACVGHTNVQAGSWFLARRGPQNSHFTTLALNASHSNLGDRKSTRLNSSHL